ncbi:MAG: YlzJ-like family protein [Syntrophomonadaceae bacterium]
MIFYWPEMQAWDNSSKPNEKRYFKLPSGGTLAAEVWGRDQLRVVEVISTDPGDYLNSVIEPGRILALKPQVQDQD